MNPRGSLIIFEELSKLPISIYLGLVYLVPKNKVLVLYKIIAGQYLFKLLEKR